jgi:hypothetical protein
VTDLVKIHTFVLLALPPRTQSHNFLRASFEIRERLYLHPHFFASLKSGKCQIKDWFCGFHNSPHPSWPRPGHLPSKLISLLNSDTSFNLDSFMDLVSMLKSDSFLVLVSLLDSNCFLLASEYFPEGGQFSLVPRLRAITHPHCELDHPASLLRMLVLFAAPFLRMHVYLFNATSDRAENTANRSQMVLYLCSRLQLSRRAALVTKPYKTTYQTLSRTLSFIL